MTQFGFKRQFRLLKPSQFKRVFDQTELRGSSPYMLLLASANNLDHPRLGFVLAKKQIKLAVQRNRVKRLVRESYRLHLQQIPALDFVVLARSGIADLDNEQIREMIDVLWFKLKRPTHGRHPRKRDRSKS